MIEFALFPELESNGFWFIIGVTLVASMVLFFLHLGLMKRWHSIAFLDRAIDKRRAKLVEAYFGAEGGSEERNALFFPAPAAAVAGFFGMGSLVLKLAPEEIDAALITACLLYVGGFVCFSILARRRRMGPPERIKPSWLLEEERRRERSGEIVRQGRAWVKNPKSRD